MGDKDGDRDRNSQKQIERFTGYSSSSSLFFLTGGIKAEVLQNYREVERFKPSPQTKAVVDAKYM